MEEGCRCVGLEADRGVDVGVREKDDYERQAEPVYAPSDKQHVPPSIIEARDNVLIA